MDPVTLILTALTSGAAASAQTTTSEAINDAYQGLKTLIQRKFAGKATAEIALVEHEKKPEVWKAPLEEELRGTGSGEDQEIIASAQKVMTLVSSTGAKVALQDLSRILPI